MKKRTFDDYAKQFRRDDTGDEKRGGTRHKFLSPSKPSKTGDTTELRLRLVPRLDENGDYKDFFVPVNRHNVTVDGQFKPLVCPGPDTCPLCALKRELDPYRNQYGDVASQLYVKTRHYAKVMAEPFDQHLDGERGPWLFIWDFAKKTKKQLENITMTKKTLLDDFEQGRDINLTCSRIGPNRMDIRYEVIDFDPSVVEEKYHHLAELEDHLDDLVSPATLEQLHAAAAALDPRPHSKKAVVQPSVSLTAPPPPKPPVAATPPPPRPVHGAPPPPPPAITIGEWHHSVDGSPAVSELTATEVAELVSENPLGSHMVWKDGLSAWVDALSIDEISSKVEQPGKSQAPSTSTAVPPPPGPPPRPPKGRAFS